MALTQEAINDAKLAEAKVANAELLSDDYKKNLLNLISISTTATNGISQEEKIQQMTDAIRILAISQVDFVTTIQKTIITTIQEQNRAQCQHCKALKHAEDVEEQAALEKLHEKWKAAEEAKALTFDGQDNLKEKNSWTDALKSMICHPGFWIFATLALVSPYTLDIIKMLISIFGGGQ